MASIMDQPPQPLKDKLTDVKTLLKTANNRLQDEVAKYEIFTTKASASSSSNAKDNASKRSEIIRTITDISTLESVLSCPIFDRIINVSDSLDQLSHQLNLHPSITEFDIDTSSGELILTPPVEFNSIQYTDNHLAQSSTALVNDQISSDSYDASNADLNNGYARAYPNRNGICRDISQQPSTESQDIISPTSVTEKLIANGMQSNINEKRDNGRRQYRSNGHFTPEVGPNVSNIGNQTDEQRLASYSNELYKTSHELHQTSAINQDNISQNATTANGRMQINQNTGCCSPSSAGSTVRLADECDSGASSFQSRGPDGANYYNFEAVKRLQPDAGLETTQVSFERDEKGLGILIAGYILQGRNENEDNDQDIDKEISGIFIKNITPGSPADRCGKIKAYDQIVSVNGIKLAGYTNDEALELMKQTGKVITLELTRHTDKVKFDKLVTNLSRAEYSRDSIKSKGNENISSTPTKPPVGPKPKNALVQVSTYQESSLRKAQAQDSLSKTAIPSPLSPSHIPVAAQRGGTNKVIETKQGSRNTIDIRSPAYQAATATYVNRLDDIVTPDSATTKHNSMIDRLGRAGSSEFVKLDPNEEPEWDKDAKIVVLHKDRPTQGLGIAEKEYANPKSPTQPIIMVTSITPGGIADRDGRLSVGDLLIFVDDMDLRGQVLGEAVKALKKTDGEASLGVLKLKRN